MKQVVNDQINLKRIEFFITYKCTSKCEHCSVYSDKPYDLSHQIDYEQAELIITNACDNYKIESVMTFGGEPLLFPELVCKIHKKAKECGIPDRQIITNGYWSNNKITINEIVSMIRSVGVNDILVSIDCFHEKHLNYEIVKFTLEQLKKGTLANIKLHPVWVENKDAVNPYNNKTKMILEEFQYLNIPISNGNILFPSGRAIQNLSEYLPPATMNIKGSCKDQPYADMPNNIESICVEPNGDIIACNAIGNINQKELMEILNDYNYKNDKVLKAMVETGSNGVYTLAKENNLKLTNNGYYSVCELCKDISVKLKKNGLTTAST
jgi:MoaA/NifB/PqqE/SkfB family radical SAM enzyme